MCHLRSPSIKPANKNLVILLLIELGIHLPDILFIYFLHLIITNLSRWDKWLLSLTNVTAFLNNTKGWYFELLRLTESNIGNITCNKEFLSFTK